jgi:hypothetical protein
MPPRSPKARFDQLIADIPAGSERAVIRVLTFHFGLKNSIAKELGNDPQKQKRPNLMDECALMGSRFSDERQLRSTIVKLRKAGYPICSSSGDGGYFLPSDLGEYREFRGREYISKIIDMRETVDRMDAFVKLMFPDEYEQYQREKSERAGQPALI